MLVTYKNNRLVPAIIISLCFVLFYWLIDPSVENYGQEQVIYKRPTKSRPGLRPKENKLQQILHNTINIAPIHSSQGRVTEVKTHTPPKVAPHNDLSPEDVLLVMKTGGTTLYNRLLVHLTTTFSHSRIPLSNTVIYSDMPDQIGPFNVIDVLANMSSHAKSRPDFDSYHQQPEYVAHNYYFEAAKINGDELGPSGGWVIDKYKFVPLMQHAGQNWPKAKWYIYMEDDAYVFLPNLLSHLSKFNWRESHYLGSHAAKSDVVFAHGGAGFALSRGAWELSFGRNPHMVEEFHEYTRDHCCGDQVLAHALRQHGVKFNSDLSWGFNQVVHWSFPFSKTNWCKPLLSWHKAHNRDVAQYYELEKGWDWNKGPLLYRDFFTEMILPGIQKRAEWWDNLSNMYEVTSVNKNTPPASLNGKYDPGLWENAWESVDACEAACKGWQECVQWSYVEDSCKMDEKVTMGQGHAPAMPQRKTALMHTCGWLHERLDRWTCS